MKVWDPHFHIWDVRPNSPSGHDSAQLFAPDKDPIYTIQRYEADLSMEGFKLIVISDRTITSRNNIGSRTDQKGHSIEIAIGDR